MDEVNPRLKALLDAARDGDDPDERTAQRVRAAVAATLAQPPSSSGERAAPTGGGMHALWKWLGVGLVTSGLIAAGVALNHRAAAPKPVPSAIVVPRPEPMRAQPATSPASSPARPEPVPEEPAAAEPAHTEAAPEPAARKPLRPAPKRPQAQATPEPRPSLGPSELALIRGATSALRDGDAGAAMRAIEQHAQLYPEGAMREERQGLRVLALCALGRTDQARRERERFLSTAPHSPLAGRVQAACGEPKAP